MKEEELLRALTEIDDMWIEEAENGGKKPIPLRWMKWGALAACLILVFTAAFHLSDSFSAKSGASLSTSGAADAGVSASEGREESDDFAFEAVDNAAASEDPEALLPVKGLVSAEWVTSAGTVLSLSEPNQLEQLTQLLVPEALQLTEVNLPEEEGQKLLLYTQDETLEMEIWDEGYLSFDGSWYAMDQATMDELIQLFNAP